MKNMNLKKLKEFRSFLNNNFVLVAISAFVIITLVVILIATVARDEFIVPVCFLMILEAAMASVLRKSELWVHALFIVLQIACGFLLQRGFLTLLCVCVYVAATVTLMILNKAKR